MYYSMNLFFCIDTLFFTHIDNKNIRRYSRDQSVKIDFFHFLYYNLDE